MEKALLLLPLCLVVSLPLTAFATHHTNINVANVTDASTATTGYELNSCQTTCSNGKSDTSTASVEPGANQTFTCECNDSACHATVACTVKNRSTADTLGMVYFNAAYNHNNSDWKSDPQYWSAMDATGEKPWDNTVAPNVRLAADASTKTQMNFSFNMSPRFYQQRVQGNYGSASGSIGTASYSDVSSYEIVPYGTSCVASSFPSWLCNPENIESNGIYRITFSYDIADDNLLSQPPAVAFQILGDDTSNTTNVLGKISRGYSFYYHDGLSKVSLKQEFTYVAPYAADTANVQPIYIQAGFYSSNSATCSSADYYDATNKFCRVGSPQEIDLASSDADNITWQGGLPKVAIEYDTDTNYNSINAGLNTVYLFNNNAHQGRVEPFLCLGQVTGCLTYASGNYVLPGAASSDADYQASLLYKHVLSVEDFGGENAGTGTAVVSNYQPLTDNSLISTKFSTSYLKSANYCELIPGGSIAGGYSINTGHCVNYQGLTNETMGVYPPPVGRPDVVGTNNQPNSTPSPMYISLRHALTASDQTQLDVCYAYVDGANGLQLQCSGQVSASGELQVQALQGSIDDTDANKTNALDLGFTYNQGKHDIDITAGGSDTTVNFIPASLMMGNVSWANKNYNDIKQNLFASLPDMRYYFDYTRGSNSASAPSKVDFYSNGFFNVSNTPVNQAIAIAPYTNYEPNGKSLNWNNNASGVKLKAQSDNGGMHYSRTTYQDSLYVYAGFPRWGAWLRNDYTNALGTQPFMVVDDAHDGANQSNNVDYYHAYSTSYNQMGYSDYDSGTLVPAYPINVAENGLAVQDLSPNTDTSNSRYGTDIERACSYIDHSDTSGASFFANSYCIYSYNDNTTSANSIKLPAASDGGDAAGYADSQFSLNGVRDIFGNFYPVLVCGEDGKDTCQ